MMQNYDDYTPFNMLNYTETLTLCGNSNCLPSSENPSEDEQKYKADLLTYYLQGICGMTVCCLGIVGNIMSIIILTRRVMRSSTYSYLAALALSDTFFLVFTMLLARKYTQEPVVGGNAKNPDNFYAYTFPFVHAACLTCQVTSIWLTLAFTVDRYIMICHPFKAERWCSIKRARRVIFGLVIGGIAFNFIRFFEYQYIVLDGSVTIHPGFFSFNFTGNFSSNLTDINSDYLIELPDSQEKTVVYFYTDLGKDQLFRKFIHIWFYLTCVAGIPFIALFILNTFLIIAVHNSRKKGKMINAKEKRRNDTTIMLIGVIVIFLICEGPALISRMRYALDFETALKSMSYVTFNDVANLLVTLNSAINIVPYYFFGKKFRQQFWRVFCSCVLTKEEIRKITRSLSVSMDRRFSNAGPNGHEMNQVAAFQAHQREDHKVYKNSIAVPLILNIEQRTSIDTQSPFLNAQLNNCLDDLSPTNSELTNDQKNVLVSLERNGNCEIIMESPCSDCQNKANL